MKTIQRLAALFTCVLLMFVFTACGGSTTASTQPVAALNAVRKAAGTNELKENSELSKVAEQALEAYVSYQETNDATEYKSSLEAASNTVESQKIDGKELTTVAIVTCVRASSSAAWNFEDATTKTASYVGCATREEGGKTYCSLVLARPKTSVTELVEELTGDLGLSVPYDSALEREAKAAAQKWPQAMRESSEEKTIKACGLDPKSRYVLPIYDNPDSDLAENLAREMQDLIGHEIPIEENGETTISTISKIAAYGYTTTEVSGKKFFFVVVRYQ